MKRRIGQILFASISVAALLAQNPAGGGQTGGQGGPGGAGGSTTPGGGGGNIPGGNNAPGRFPTQPREDPNQRFPDFNQNRPIFVQGKVMLDDGTPPSEPIVIQRVCNGRNAVNEGYTDSRGHFSFELGRNQAVMQDASSSNDDFGTGPLGSNQGGAAGRMGGGGAFGRQGGISEQQLMGCEIRAQLPGYRSDAVQLAGRRSLDNPNVGTIILRRMANVSGLTTSATSMMAPKEAKKAYEKGHKLAMNKKNAEAQKELESAVALYPKYASAWYELGLIREVQNQNEPAMEAYAKSIEADSKFIKPYLQIAVIHARAQKWQETADTTEKAIKLNPYDFPLAYFYNAVANFNLQKIDEAEKSAREGVKIDSGKKMPKMMHVLGVILAQKDDLPGAVENLKSYLKFAPTDAGAKDQLAKIEGMLAQKTPANPPPNQY